MHRVQWLAGGCVVGIVATLIAQALFAGRLAPPTAAAAHNPLRMRSAAAHRAVIAQPIASKADGKLRVVAFGAHPDDCEIRCGGTALLWSEKGHHVQFVSATNGDIGHWRMSGGALAQRRYEEVQQAAKIRRFDERARRRALCLRSKTAASSEAKPRNDDPQALAARAVRCRFIHQEEPTSYILLAALPSGAPEVRLLPCFSRPQSRVPVPSLGR